MNTRLKGRGLYPWRFNPFAAFHLASGVSQSTRSTPAVRLPWFSVTRRTAKYLAERERVSIRCRELTLRHLPSRQAFAIRNCIARTFR